MIASPFSPVKEAGTECAVRKGGRGLGRVLPEESEKKLQKESRQSPETPDGAGDSQVFFGAAVGAEQNQQPNPGGGGKSCDEGTEAQGPFQIEPGEEHRSGTVGDEAQKGGSQGLQETAGQEEGGETLLAQELHSAAQHQVHKADKKENAGSVPEGGGKNAAFFAVAVVAEAVDAFLGAAFPGSQPAPTEIHQQPGSQAQDYLNPEERE